MFRSTRIIFMGTPEFALPTFEALVNHYSIVGVVTQPDRRAGRGRSLQPPPVKRAALTHNLPLFQPKTLRNPEAFAQLRDWAPDIIVTAATGHILTPEVLSLPTQGTLNVHASLLPRWRGAAPIQAAILAGDTETGVTIMCTDEGLDTGPILSQKAIPVGPRETAASLHDKLSQLGADLLLETIPRWLTGDLKPRPQPGEGVTVASMIRKEDGLIDWERPAVEIDRQVRAFDPWPGAFTFWGQLRLRVVKGFPLSSLRAEEMKDGSKGPGTVVLVESFPTVVTDEGLLRLDEVQVAGKRVVSGPDFVHGHADFIGARLKASQAPAST